MNAVTELGIVAPTNAHIVGRCDKCGAEFVHIQRDGIECAYRDCAGHVHFDSAFVREYVEQLAEASATLARVTALLDMSTVGHSAEWLRQQLRTALMDPATSAAIASEKALELREETAG